MKEKIEATNAFKTLEPLAQRMVSKRANRIQIEDNIIQARNLGLEQWKTQTALCNKWQTIVEQVIKSENDTTL
ncbi:hypothetical protein [Flavobacterium sp. UMI-01]|uniref:hypothetical protein n=1 Tax=Flavobacterium sp. UMI-01 TaxID=1441053 RepID=UPI001C7DD66F|nr:hypothetical protein [Flavobacterium sp. UMI-01]GIZ10264.1 hypothetical protein FUMI01_29880 [Flavobacterium sp. UMI-01]